MDKTDKFGEKIPNKNTSRGDVQLYLIRSVVMSPGTAHSHLSQTFKLVAKWVQEAVPASCAARTEHLPGLGLHGTCLVSVSQIFRDCGANGITGQCPVRSHELLRGLRLLSYSAVSCPFEFLSGS